MFGSARIRIVSGLMLALAAAAVGYMIFSATRMGQANEAVRDAWADRYQSYLLADEFRQSSDDLTRLARTYVLTGDDRYETQYMDILAIRNGQQERPAAYHRIYWDFLAADRPASGGSGVTRPLADLMKDAGFTEAEFALLAQAQANSDGLVGLEVRAMNAVKGIFADTAGAYTVRGAPDAALAAGLLHSRDYHAFKADIMAPVNEFLATMEQRFDTRIAALQAGADRARTHVIGAAILLAGVTAALAAMLAVMILHPLSRLSRTMAAVARDEPVDQVPCIGQSDEFGLLAREIAAAIATGAANRAMVSDVAMLVDAAREGDFSRTIPNRPGREDLQRICDGLNQMMAALDRAFATILNAMRGLAEGDLTRPIDSRLPGRLGEVLANAEAARSGLAELIRQSRDGTRELSGRIGDMSHAIDQLQHRTESSAAALEETSAALLELSSSVSEASKRATDADRIADNARRTAGHGLEVMGEVTAAMQDIRGSANEITAIVDMIGSIAFQTNLLALNARVEAARAGEAGKGFAVVASEVSALALRASEATESIGALIGKSGEQVERGATLIDSAAGTINEISAAIGEISDLAAVIAAAMREQSVGLEEVTTAVGELDRSTQQNSSMVSSTTAETEALRSVAADLTSGMDRFRLAETGPGGQADYRLAS
ncbi:methyl-accepting chemotaxis protein [Rhodovulum strictum]|uniref:HAMP domain-containing protein n=1 Tax=Rhodovulum strictum TaxID=58314 RepID=A0A844B496_9RHOB|nr:methyl-accepting chemotaxis protein [Rhodovulum strictum]MRH21196.1 HAMP domain-containing protein [Rhodovulum strictum]